MSADFAAIGPGIEGIVSKVCKKNRKDQGVFVNSTAVDSGTEKRVSKIRHCEG